MSLTEYFSQLIQKVESSTEITNEGGKDKNGFYKPVRTVVLRHLQLLKDLNQKPLAKPMLKASWAAISETLPPEWLVVEDGDDRAALKKILE